MIQCRCIVIMIIIVMFLSDRFSIHQRQPLGAGEAAGHVQQPFVTWQRP